MIVVKRKKEVGIEPLSLDVQQQLCDVTVDELLAYRTDAWIQHQRMALLGQLSPYLAHDIVQPLSSICNFTGGLLVSVSNAPLLNETLSSTLINIHQEAFRASDIVKQLLSCTQRNPSEPSSLTINDSIHQSLEIAKGLLDTEHCVVKRVLGDRLPLVPSHPPNSCRCYLIF